MGVQHGISVSGDRERLRDAVMFHLTNGDCALSANDRWEGCIVVMQRYSHGGDTGDSLKFQTLIFTNILPRIPLRPLQRLLRLHSVTFDPDASLNRHRRVFKTFIDSSRPRIASSGSRPQVLLSQTDWPRVVSEEDKMTSLRMFNEETCSSSLREFVCASCNGRICVKQKTEVRIEDMNMDLLKRPDRRFVDGRVLDDLWLDTTCKPPPLPVFEGCLKDVLVAPAGLLLRGGVPHMLQLCKSCHRLLRRGRTPDLALANHMYMGDVPDELNGLSVVEEALIARCRAKSCIIQLRESMDGVVPNAQRAMRGHIIIFPQQPEYVLDLLPPPLDEVATYICVVFVGSHAPTSQWLRQHARPLLVRRERVLRALKWLQTHNRYYKDIRLNMDVLNSLEDEGILPVHIDVVPSTSAQESLVSGYEPRVDSEGSDVHLDSQDVFQSVVVADVDANSSPSILRAAAMEHIKKKGARYLQVPHGGTPVGDFNNPSLLPMTFPSLFPYGLGGSEDRHRSSPVSLQRHMKHLFSIADTRFQTHYSFMFVVFNLLQRRRILLHSSLKVNRRSFDAFKTQFSQVSPSAVRVVAERMLKGDHRTNFTSEEVRVHDLLKQVTHVTTRVQGANAARVVMRNKIRGLMIEKGMPSFYITVNPADIYNPIVKFLAGCEIDIDAMSSDQVPTFWSQSILVANNPAVCAKFFRLYMDAFVKTLLGFQGTSGQPRVGVLGRVAAYYGCVEAQGRGSLHCHMLVWLVGGLNPDEIKERLLHAENSSFRDNLLAFLEDSISTSIPEDPLPEQEIPSSLFHPSSVRAPTLDANPDVARKHFQKDIHFLAKSSQVHRHTHTCFKYWRGPPEPRECRFGLDNQNYRRSSTIYDDTGEISLRCLDGLVNYYNDTILAVMHCNMNIQFIGLGQSAKAILYYVTDYITKAQLKMHVAYAALEAAVNKVGEYDLSVDDLAGRVKCLLQNVLMH